MTALPLALEIAEVLNERACHAELDAIAERLHHAHPEAAIQAVEIAAVLKSMQCEATKVSLARCA